MRLQSPHGRVTINDLLASFVVFLIALPLCMGIAIASGVSPAQGIITGIIGGIVTGALAGCPLQVSGPAAGLTIIVWQLVQNVGLAGLSAVVLLAGLFQMAAGWLRIGRWFQAVAPAVIHGMLAGIGVLIFASQFHVMLDDKPKGSGLANLLSIPSAFRQIYEVEHGDFSHFAAVVGLITILVLIVWTRVPARVRRVLPAPLMGIIAGSCVAGVMRYPVQYVNVPSNLFGEISPSLPSLDLLSQGVIWTSALALAFVASAESLLSAAAVDQMQKGPRARYDKELMAQGVGNALCGLVGCLPMTGVIVRSSANIESGAQTRASAMLHGLWLLVFVAALPGVLRLIPVSALAALLVYTGYKLVYNPNEFRALVRHGKWEVGIFLVTVVAIVCTNLLHGVIIGFAVSAVRLLLAFTRLQVDVVHVQAHRYELKLEGTACFLTIPKLIDALDQVPDGSELHVHFERLSYVDHACLELLSSWEQRQAALGGSLVVEWHELERRFHGGSGPQIGAHPTTAEQRLELPEAVAASA